MSNHSTTLQIIASHLKYKRLIHLQISGVGPLTENWGKTWVDLLTEDRGGPVDREQGW